MAREIQGSTITLYSNIKVEKGMTPIFSSAINREHYFQGHIVRANVNCTYVRRTRQLKVEIPLSVVDHCNYISFVNPSFENRIWYCYIVNYEYENNECTLIDYVVDPLMTYMFDYTMQPCMLSRQMLSLTDTAKANTNPYDPTIWQFTTDEPLSTIKELEKPMYSVQKYLQGQETDGKYMLSSVYVSEATAYQYDVGEHVMGVMFIAPLSTEKLDEGIENNYVESDDWTNVTTGVRAGIQSIVNLNIPEVPGADPTLWDSTVNNVIQYLNTTAVSAKIPTEYKTSIINKLNATTGHDPSAHEYRTRYYFMQLVDQGVMSTGGTPSAQWVTLLQRIVDAGGYTFPAKSSYVSGNGTYAGRVPHSSFARGYDIIAIPNMIGSTGIQLFSEVLEFLTKYDSISQIVGIYALNDYVFRSAFVDGQGVVPSPADIAQNNIYTVPTSFYRMNDHKQTAVANKKLLTFPYSYMRVVSPDGNIKEYKYEDFGDVMLGTGYPKFKIMGDLNSHPSIIMAPIKYKMYSTSYTFDGVDMSDATNVNLDEMICYDEFAQVPFVTDAYLTYLAGQVMKTYGQNTLEQSDHMNMLRQQAIVGAVNNAFNGVNDLLGGVNVQEVTPSNEAFKSNFKAGLQSPYKTLGGNPMSFAKVGIDTVGTIVDYNSAMMDTRHWEGELEDAKRYLKSNGTDFNYGRFNGTKPSHANDIYHPGTNGGIYHYLKGITTTDFILEHVQLKDMVLAKYDRYFTYYGYNEAGRTSVPYVYNFMRGIQDNSKLPTWNIDDENDSITYIQTMDAHVTGIPLPYASYIEDLFNSGIRCINGDLLIQGGNNNG